MALTYTETKNYTIARGDLFFAERSAAGVLSGERAIGNTPSIGLTISSEYAKHYDSSRGVRTQDRAVPVQVDRMGKFTTDDVNARNLALLLLGSAEAVTITSAAAQTETFVDVQQGLRYQVGISTAHPAGLEALSAVVVKVGATAKTLNTDYTLDGLGGVTVVVGGGIAALADMIVEYDRPASTQDRTVSGSTPAKGALRVIEHNPEGDDKTWYFPDVTLTPDGDFTIKGENDWQSMPFSLSINEPAVGEAILVNGRAFTA
jgi:hypothetical protein